MCFEQLLPWFFSTHTNTKTVGLTLPTALSYNVLLLQKTCFQYFVMFEFLPHLCQCRKFS